jgi:hypothetical protein
MQTGILAMIISRMLKRPAIFALSSWESSASPRGSAFGFYAPAALLKGLLEHPASPYASMPLERVERALSP